MAILPIKKKDRKIFNWILLIIALILVAWFGRDFFVKPSFLSPSSLPQEKKTEINFEVLKNPLLQDLQPFEEIPSFEGETGRENPFLPY
ncbi:hypothetical protein IH779_00830 [Patescibacteria group bacterium]|nr:hypothetical protein [Patescibacteria group bacterium]